MQMIEGNGGNQFRQYVGQNVRNQNGYNAIQNVGNQVVQNAVQNPATRDEGNGNGNNLEQSKSGSISTKEGYGSSCRNCTQASTSGTQTDKAPVYDSDGSAEVHHFENCYDNDIFNMFTQEEQYTELLKPISEPHQVQQNDSNVISAVSSVEQSGGTVEQNPSTIEETPKFVRDFKSLVKESDESIAKHKALEFEIERLLRAVVS
ncbi:hypothetical protein Tco_1077877, partial [Tanacetum coccineum]